MTENDAVGYVRISNDPEGREVGVGRQTEDINALAGRLGVRIIYVFSDNDAGASTLSHKPRPDFDRMMEQAREGRFRTILSYSNSRLTRRPRENEDLIDLYEKHGVTIHTVVSGRYDLSTADGRAVARTIGAWDAAEAERTGERVRRAFLQRAEQGLPHGPVAYGYRRELQLDERGRQTTVEVLDDTQAAVVTETARRLIEGNSLRSIVINLNARGVSSPRGLEWESTTLRQIMGRERNAGRRVHKGQVIGRATWPAILEDGVHDRVVALLNDPARRSSRGASLKYLLSGIALCGRCEAPLRVNAAEKAQAPAYVCKSCYRLRRRVESVDAVVVAAVIARLSMPDGPDLAAADADELHDAQADVAAIRARMDIAADQCADEEIDAHQLARITARLRPRLEAAEARVRAAQPSLDLAPFAGAQAATAWDAATLDIRRAVIRTLLTVTVLPQGPGRAFDPATVKIEWA